MSCSVTANGPNAAAAAGRSFLEVAAVAWRHLTGRDCRAIRATSRDGRHLFDSLNVFLRVNFGAGNSFPAPSSEELERSVGAAIARGTKPKSLEVQLSDRVDFSFQEQQL
jgi:hypothetical protein